MTSVYGDGWQEHIAPDRKPAATVQGTDKGYDWTWST